LSVLVDAVFRFVAASVALPAATVAVTVPEAVMPETATLYVIPAVPVAVTTAVVAPAVPLRVTSPVAKSVTGCVNTTVKLIGDAAAGSAWPAAWLMVTPSEVKIETELAAEGTEVPLVLSVAVALIEYVPAANALVVIDHVPVDASAAPDWFRIEST